MKEEHFFDSHYNEKEQIPRNFIVSFEEVGSDEKRQVKVVYNNSSQVGDIISDNSYTNDFYRYHDIFHYSFATLLGWSPCARAMMKRKRKSDVLVDEVEDGARAAITEEALSMIIFSEAKRKDYFKSVRRVSRTTLRIIKDMTETFEVRIRSEREWEKAILKSYQVFRLLTENNGGKVEFNALNKTINYSKLN